MATTYIQLNSGDPSVLDGSMSGDFTIQLGKSFTFDEDHEVFLSEAVLLFTWYNITVENNKLTVGDASIKSIKIAPAFYVLRPG